MKNKKILLNGGTGFIGSNLAETLLGLEQVSLVRVPDNFATGHLKNLDTFIYIRSVGTVS